MNDAIFLFLLRILSAIILLGFLGTIAWLVYQDLRQTSAITGEVSQIKGHLRVVASDSVTAGAGSVFPLLPVTGIGRAEHNTIVLEDGFVSGEHALLSWHDNQWWLEDLHSRNGTLLNDLLITDSTVVSPGDIITIGSVQLKIEPTEISG
jgi:pSer/pThr/pTyr-binding forkhead associated (FHA) protein